MSNRNGDKARHNRQRKEKIRRRTITAALSSKEKTAKPAGKAAK